MNVENKEDKAERGIQSNYRKSYPLLFERSRPGKRAADFPPLDVPEMDALLPKELLGGALPLPELSESELIRHYTGLSRRNFGVDNGSYPLGSCTMKYNPKINEEVSSWFSDLHPLLAEGDLSAVYDLMAELDGMFCELCGMDKFTLQPAAGAQGELTGLMMIKAYHEMRNEHERNEILVPDSAHGTNPASAAMAGFRVVEIKSGPDGGVDLADLREKAGSRTAGLMLTNPSTLGLFEKNILEIADIIHRAGGLLYYDGANLNAIMGIVRPGDMGFDVVHLNLHKTFSTPHGGGGPGAGPVGVKKELIPFLPYPVIQKPDGKPAYPDYERPLSIGRVKAFNGQISVLVKAYAYMISLGGEGLKAASEQAVLNANYLQCHLKQAYELPHKRTCMHEFVLTPGDALTQNGIRAADIAKAMIDLGVHPPTVYFPLILPEAMMFEPTETESKEELDQLVAVMMEVYDAGRHDPEALHRAPVSTPVGRPDETRAARVPVVRWQTSNR